MNDPLAPFRKRSATPEKAPSPIETTGRGGYQAFEAKDRVERLRIRPANQPWQSPFYHHIANIAYDGEFGTNFMLMLGFMKIQVTGKNLQAVINAIELGQADFIQEFDPDKWDKPTDANAAFIESIGVIEEGSPPDSTGSKTVH